MRWPWSHWPSQTDVEPLPLPDQLTWAELTTLDYDTAVDVRAEVMAGRAPLSSLPDWPAARAGDRAALDRIVATANIRDKLASRPEPR